MKKITILLIALFLCVLMPMTAQAVELTEGKPGGSTEVIASVIPNSGDVTYIITVPDVVDFGTLTPPASDEDSYRDVTYTVVAEEVEGLDPDSQQIMVYVKDQNATGNERNFYIVNKSNSNMAFSYNIYRAVGEENLNEASRVNNGGYFTAGYYLCSFTEGGQTLEGTLRINQRDLRDMNMADIIGDYSGYMVFYSIIESQ